MGPSSSYGMGWQIRGQPGSRIIDHTGDTSNFHSNMLLLPDQQIGIVILINVSGYSQVNAINIPIEGVAAILLGHDLTAAVDPPANWISPLVPLVPLFILVIWIAGSYLSIQRWRQRGKLPPRGSLRFWRYFLPLAIDLFLAVMTHWRPRRAWFAQQAPKLHAAALAAETLPLSLIHI